MKKYFIHNGIEQRGPFDIDELKSQNLHKNSLIWFEGINDWTKAIEISELSELLKSLPPPLPSIPPPLNQAANPTVKT